MEKRIKQAFNHVKIPKERKNEMFEQLLADSDEMPERKTLKVRKKEAWIAGTAAALLAMVLLREPMETLARQLFFPAKDSITGEMGIQSVNLGEMEVTKLQKPEDMKPIQNQVLELEIENSGNASIETKEKLLGSRKQYESLDHMEEELGLTFLHSRKLEERPFSTSLCIYDQEGLSQAMVDAVFSYGEEQTKICMEIIIELENPENEYHYGMNQQSDYQGIYRREDGLFEAMLMQDNKLMGPDSSMWIKSGESSLRFDHKDRSFVPLHTYEAVFYYEGMRYNIYGAETSEMLEEILDSLSP